MSPGGWLVTRGAVALVLALLSAIAAADFRGSLTVTGLGYPQAPRFATQGSSQGSVDVEGVLEVDHALTNRVQLALDVRANVDFASEDVVFADATEAALYFEDGDFRLGAGMLDSRWGVLNAENLVDVFNQRDLVRDYQGDVHLGQPGVALRYLGEPIGAELLLSPYSRERRLAEGRDRYRFTGLDYRSARFEGGPWDFNVAARVAFRGDDLELGLSQFVGHSREPELVVSGDPALGPPSLVPFYRRIAQTGLDAQLVVGDYVLRGEGLFRRGQTGGGFFGLAAGSSGCFTACSAQRPTCWRTQKPTGTTGVRARRRPHSTGIS